MKIFISHHHELNNSHRLKIQEIFKSLKDRIDIEDLTPNEVTKFDDNLSDEEIREKIRDKYLKNVDITIVVVGGDTRHRKFIDWEIYSSLYEYGKFKSAGIVVVNCCLTQNRKGEFVCKSWILDKELIEKYDPIGERRKSPGDWPDSITEEEWGFLPTRLFNSMKNNYSRDDSIKCFNENSLKYKHAVFPIIGYDKLKTSNGPEILRLAIRQAEKFREENATKWDLTKLRKKDNESEDRVIYKQIEY